MEIHGWPVMFLRDMAQDNIEFMSEMVHCVLLIHLSLFLLLQVNYFKKNRIMITILLLLFTLNYFFSFISNCQDNTTKIVQRTKWCHSNYCCWRKWWQYVFCMLSFNFILFLSSHNYKQVNGVDYVASSTISNLPAGMVESYFICIFVLT